MFNNKFTKKDSVVDAVSQVLESWDDDEDDDVKRADAELRRMKAKPIEADKKTDPDKEIGKLAKKTPKEVDESVEQIDELSKKTLANYMRANTKRMADPKNPDSMERKMKRHDDYFKASKKFHEDKWSDIADGEWKKTKKTTSQAMSAAANAAGKGLKGAQHKLDVAEPKGKLTAADFKKLRKEDAGQIDEISGELATRYKKKALGGKSYDDDSWNELSRKRQKGIGLANRKVTQSLHPHNPEKHAKVPVTWKEESELSEKTLTPAESKKKEEIVKSMKKGLSGFKERYGKRAKEVMYATATKQAKKVAEEVEQIDESWDRGASKSYVSDAVSAVKQKKAASEHLSNAKRHPEGSAFHNDYMAKHHSALAKYIKHSYHSAQYGSQEDAKKDYKKHMSLSKSYKQGKMDEAYTGKGNHKPGWMLKADPKLAQKLSDAKKAARPPLSSPSKEYMDKMKKVEEEIESVDEKVKVKVSINKPIGYKVSDVGPGKKEYNVKTDKAWDDAQKKKNVSEAQGPTSTYSSDTFAQPENPTSSAITPLQRIKALVQPTKKLLNNTLMGKAGATSEEIDPSVKSTDTLKGRVKGGKSDDVGPGADGKSTKVKYIPGPK